MPFKPHLIRPDDDWSDGDETCNLPLGAAEAESEEDWLEADLFELTAELTSQAQHLNACYPAGGSAPAQQAINASDRKRSLRNIAAVLAPLLFVALTTGAWFAWNADDEPVPQQPVTQHNETTSPGSPDPVSVASVMVEADLSAPDSTEANSENTVLTPVFLRDASQPELEAMYDIWEQDGETTIEI